MPFTIYFFIELKDVPSMNGSDIFYFIIMSGVAGLIYLVLFLLLPFLYFVLVEICCSGYLDHKNTRKYVILSNIITLAIVLSMVFIINKESNLINSVLFATITLCSFIAIAIYKKINNISARENKEFLCYFLFFIVLNFIILLIVVIVNYYILFLAIGNIFISIYYICFYMVSVIYIYIGIYKKDIFIFKLFVSIFIVFNLIFLLPTLSYNIMTRLNFGNIDYKYIILDKNAKLPYEICDGANIKNIKEVISYKNGNLIYKLENNTTKSLNISIECLTFENKDSNKTMSEPTYFTKNDNQIKLYNIKALSTLGDKWFIESSNGFRFKIDKRFIKTEIKK